MNHHNPILFCESFDGINAANHLGCIKHDVNTELTCTSMIKHEVGGYGFHQQEGSGSTPKIITFDVVSCKMGS